MIRISNHRANFLLPPPMNEPAGEWPIIAGWGDALGIWRGLGIGRGLGELPDINPTPGEADWVTPARDGGEAKLNEVAGDEPKFGWSWLPCADNHKVQKPKWKHILWNQLVIEVPTISYLHIWSKWTSRCVRIAARGRCEGRMKSKSILLTRWRLGTTTW